MNGFDWSKRRVIFMVLFFELNKPCCNCHYHHRSRNSMPCLVWHLFYMHPIQETRFLDTYQFPDVHSRWGGCHANVTPLHKKKMTKKEILLKWSTEVRVDEERHKHTDNVSGKQTTIQFKHKTLKIAHFKWLLGFDCESVKCTENKCRHIFRWLFEFHSKYQTQPEQNTNRRSKDKYLMSHPMNFAIWVAVFYFKRGK